MSHHDIAGRRLGERRDEAGPAVSSVKDMERIAELERAIRHALYELTENGHIDAEDHDTDPRTILREVLP
jgi:hypothetical protein